MLFPTAVFSRWFRPECGNPERVAELAPGVFFFFEVDGFFVALGFLLLDVRIFAVPRIGVLGSVFCWEFCKRRASLELLFFQCFLQFRQLAITPDFS